jgi:hypothetical protein
MVEFILFSFRLNLTPQKSKVKDISPLEDRGGQQIFRIIGHDPLRLDHIQFRERRLFCFDRNAGMDRDSL